MRAESASRPLPRRPCPASVLRRTAGSPSRRARWPRPSQTRRWRWLPNRDWTLPGGRRRSLDRSDQAGAALRHPAGFERLLRWLVWPHHRLDSRWHKAESVPEECRSMWDRRPWPLDTPRLPDPHTLDGHAASPNGDTGGQPRSGSKPLPCSRPGRPRAAARTRRRQRKSRRRRLPRTWKWLVT